MLLNIIIETFFNQFIFIYLFYNLVLIFYTIKEFVVNNFFHCGAFKMSLNRHFYAYWIDILKLEKKSVLEDRGKYWVP